MWQKIELTFECDENLLIKWNVWWLKSLLIQMIFGNITMIYILLNLIMGAILKIWDLIIHFHSVGREGITIDIIKMHDKSLKGCKKVIAYLISSLVCVLRKALFASEVRNWHKEKVAGLAPTFGSKFFKGVLKNIQYTNTMNNIGGTPTEIEPNNDYICHVINNKNGKQMIVKLIRFKLIHLKTFAFKASYTQNRLQ